MPLTDDKWQAFIHEYNGAMSDVEAELRATLEGTRFSLRALADRRAIADLEAQALLDTVRESLLRVQGRLNAIARRLMEIREAGEL